ncbi:SUMO-activating enzyme subunit 2 [Wickerhamomyces ciferrii]|uniref:Ubiquitin-activating enzyme E1-like n=1 Tax=Wickerhamomyces ciferrii (strain ATCC 14091 / BCRC 22168 / CBS 111 / JCM 3599 / NBRC 0793 / NRRL Y-1031 F-60-10) TaxID=1206466 RepID=K0KL57_WICCF|nr:SUMO-activating enzyme subunit 2 [Wickerhamomyces ciferrii]CCH43726.1 SUMO-activating enzyme subunit 2 [Wickerhamomyces ciferrii]
MTTRKSGLQAVLVLLVGAGGIGCELLKDLILLGYGEVHVVDLDTIDLSNLNRQFLFRQKDIKKPKASTAVNAVESFNFQKTKLIPYQSSIYDTDLFPLSWFKQFDIIFNALDNIAARSYINKIGLFLNKRIMESGTTGTQGQAQPTFPNKTECYDCVHRETPKTFPVCTIRSTPSQPIHCIHWAKSFLFNSLFAEDEISSIDENSENQNLGTDNKDEIKNLINENNELNDLKKSILNENFTNKVIEKIFQKDIEKLLLITSLWKSRTPPIPLNVSQIDLSKAGDLGTGQNQWTIEQNLKVFIQSTKNLQQRVKSGEKEIEFDKDDEDTLEFVASAANLRSFIFGIPLKSKFDIKSIAGNIIPAIATTNAIIAGFSALLSIKLFNNDIGTQIEESKSVYTSQGNSKFVSPSWLTDPNPNCASCSIPRGIINIDNEKTFQDLITALVDKYGYEDEEISISLGSKLLYDPDFDDNKERKLLELGIKYGEHLSISDETDVKKTIDFYVELNQDGEINLPDLEIPNKPKVEEQKDENKEDEDEDDDFELLDDNNDDVLIIEPVEPVEKRKIDSKSSDEHLDKKQKI